MPSTRGRATHTGPALDRNGRFDCCSAGVRDQPNSVALTSRQAERYVATIVDHPPVEVSGFGHRLAHGVGHSTRDRRHRRHPVSLGERRDCSEHSAGHRSGRGSVAGANRSSQSGEFDDEFLQESVETLSCCLVGFGQGMGSAIAFDDQIDRAMLQMQSRAVGGKRHLTGRVTHGFRWRRRSATDCDCRLRGPPWGPRPAHRRWRGSIRRTRPVPDRCGPAS